MNMNVENWGDDTDRENWSTWEKYMSMLTVKLKFSLIP